MARKSYAPHVGVTLSHRTPSHQRSTIVHDMHTRSSPAQSVRSDSDSTPDNAGPEPKVPAVHWSQDNEIAFIDFLIAHKAEGGDGLNFKASVWTAAAEHMRPLTTKGGPKNPDKCKAKWGRVRHMFFMYFY